MPKTIGRKLIVSPESGQLPPADVTVVTRKLMPPAMKWTTMFI
jgi:hypothetical protein